MTPAQKARLDAARRMTSLPSLVKFALDDYQALAGELARVAEIPALRADVDRLVATVAARDAEIAKLRDEAAERRASRVADQRKHLAALATLRNELAEMRAMQGEEVATLRAALEVERAAAATRRPRRSKSLKPRAVCTVAGCKELEQYKGLCRRHYEQHWRLGRGKPCMVCGGERSTCRPGRCRKCYLRSVMEGNNVQQT